MPGPKDVRLKYLALALLVLLLAACGPAQIVVTASAGDVLPAEAQRVIDRATATAGAIATQVAQVTATDQSARATATAAAQLTRDNLAAEQTRAALSLTVGAGQADATNAAAERTQAAESTLGARVQAVDATRRAATPTAAARASQSALGATQAAVSAGRAESAGQFWALLRWTVLAVVGTLGAVVCVLLVVWGVKTIRIEELRQKAAIARDAFRVLSPGHWAEWMPDQGYQVYMLPAPVDEPAVVIENVPAQPDRLHAWRQTVRLFAWWGDRYGFGIRELGASGAAVVTDPAWRTLSKLLKDAGVLAEVTKPGQRGRVTAWAEGWDYRRLAHELTYGPLALPFPDGTDPPKVAFTVPTQHHNSGNTTRNTEGLR